MTKEGGGREERLVRRERKRGKGEKTLTLQEGHKLPECPVRHFSFPLVQNDAVLRLELH